MLPNRSFWFFDSFIIIVEHYGSRAGMKRSGIPVKFSHLFGNVSNFVCQSALTKLYVFLPFLTNLNMPVPVTRLSTSSSFIWWSLKDNAPLGFSIL